MEDLAVTFEILCKATFIFSFLLLLLVVGPACLGIEIGIRKGYIRLLMRLFQWGTRRLQKEGEMLTSEDIIEKENSINRLGSLSDCVNEPHKKFKLPDVSYLVKSGIEAVIDDEVTKRFRAEELPSWNLLTRTDFHYRFIRKPTCLPTKSADICVRLSILWLVGVLLRYCILFPLRLVITVFALSWILCTMLPLAALSDSSFKRRMGYYVNVVGFRIICRALSAVVTYHDRENMPQPGGICVANHTTTLDAAVLMQDRPYAVLGQIHGGFLGGIMRIMSRATKHVWFERSEVRDRQFVSKRIMEHVSDLNNFPVLLFPEGTCINNTSVMMFKKGSFEMPTTIYPVAIKYNPWFGDAFWNSSKHSMLQYLLVVMTSWAIVADVWYLPAMKREPEETAVQFAERVKAVIARKGGLVDCVWDGQLKRMRVKESYLREKQKELGELYGECDELGQDHQCVKRVRFNLSTTEEIEIEQTELSSDSQSSDEGDAETQDGQISLDDKVEEVLGQSEETEGLRLRHNGEIPA
uniref:Glycerol-3-phosphate acyltransferase 4-like n=1 Tax=Phallusia mammillata TaxID=59560 RepID=A0A6F9D5H6_9ASCI|nr:glycerol-3-phosphate acyltransferase 4-like [Phallusia mammillata]